MTINKKDFYNWQASSKLDRVRFGGKASPNVVAFKEHLLTKFGGVNAGIVNKRKRRGAPELSTHYFGAAIDWRYPTRAVALQAMKELVANSKEYGVQMVIDYVGCTIWTPKQGWRKLKPEPTGVGQAWAKWIHIESTKTQWRNSIPLVNRLSR